MNIPRILPALLLLGATACLHLAPEAEPDIKKTPTAHFGAAPAKVTRINPEFGFVVLDFQSRTMPVPGTQLIVYRQRERVGMVEITPPARSRYATADVIEGEAKLGDEVQ